MRRIESLEEFSGFRLRVLREKGAEEAKPCLVICAGTGGQASGSNDILRMIKRTILERKLQERISLRITGCQGFCQMDPFIVVEPGKHLYPRVKKEDLPRIIDAALNGRVVEELLYQDPSARQCFPSQGDIPFFRNQMRLILGMNQQIDPIRILNYIEQGGYAAFEKVMCNPDPHWIIREIQLSGLRGRGGGRLSHVEKVGACPQRRKHGWTEIRRVQCR